MTRQTPPGIGAHAAFPPGWRRPVLAKSALD